MLIDIRTLHPSVRPATVFKAFDALEVGEQFEIANDHDPMGVSRLFEVMRPNTYSWEYLESGPEVWRVRIGRIAPPAANEPDTTQLSCGCHH